MTFHYYLIPYFIDAHNEYFACIFIYVKVNYLIDVLCGNLMFMPLNINCPISATNFVCVHPKLYLSLFHHDFYRAGVHDISSDMKILQLDDNMKNTSLLVTYYAMISPGLEYTIIFLHVLFFETEGGNEGRGSMDNKGR